MKTLAELKAARVDAKVIRKAKAKADSKIAIQALFDSPLTQVLTYDPDLMAEAVEFGLTATSNGIGWYLSIPD